MLGAVALALTAEELCRPAEPGFGKELGFQMPPRLANLLDSVSEVWVDPDTENEYWVLRDVPPALKGRRILRKEASIPKVVVAGLAAGMVVELANATVLHPLDTIKTRLQAVPDKVDIEWPSFERLFDGFVPVAVTVPLLATFWAVKDVVRVEILGVVAQQLPWPLWRDVVATTIAAACGEAAYIMLKTPGEVLKTRQQAEVLHLLDNDLVGNLHLAPPLEGEHEHAEEETEPSSSATVASDALAAASTSIGSEASVLEEEREPKSSATVASDAPTPASTSIDSETETSLLEEFFRAWPVLSVVDVPYVALRTAFFVGLHDSHLAPDNAGGDTICFAISAMIASLVTTPLDVARTQLLLSGSGVEALPTTLSAIWQEGGLSAMLAGWSPRFLWNGIIVGISLGLCRQSYDGIRTLLFLNVLDPLEDTLLLSLRASEFGG